MVSILTSDILSNPVEMHEYLSEIIKDFLQRKINRDEAIYRVANTPKVEAVECIDDYAVLLVKDDVRTLSKMLSVTISIG